MWTGRATRRANFRDHIADMDAGANFHRIPRIVGIARHVAIAVVDLDNIAITAANAGIGDHAFRDRMYIRAQRHVEIDAQVRCAFARERISANAIAGRNIALRRGQAFR